MLDTSNLLVLALFTALGASMRHLTESCKIDVVTLAARGTVLAGHVSRPWVLMS